MATIYTSSLPLTNPLLEALETEIVTTRCRNGSVRKLHTKGTIKTLVKKLKNVIMVGRLWVGVVSGTGQEHLSLNGLILVRQ